tara:strand:+ start:98 stop:304 length:207 start_codon:yes stop_codon:yes gene_type:complete
LVTNHRRHSFESPEGGRRLTLNNLSFIHLSLFARLKFNVKAGNVKEYGNLDEKIYTQGGCTHTAPLAS